MRAVEHEDREGAEFIYELYEIVSTDSFFIGDIEEFVDEKKKIHDFLGDKLFHQFLGLLLLVKKYKQHL